MQKRLEAIAGQLYDGVLAPQDWYVGLDDLRHVLGASVFHFFTLDASGAPMPESVGNPESQGLHAGVIEEYETHHAGNDLRMAVVAQMPVTHVMIDHEHISAAEASRNSVYTDWLLPLGLSHTACAIVRMQGEARDFISFIRPRDARAYDAQDKAFLEHLMPHIARAARLRAQAGHLSHQAQMGLGCLDSLPHAMIVVDTHCRVHHANRAAERLLAKQGALQSRHGRLICARENMQMQLQQLVRGACARPARADAFVVRGDTADQPIVMLTVLPLPACHAFADSWQRPLALVTLRVPGADALLDQAVIGDVLGLSPSEARLLLMVASGKTVKDYAQEEGCSWHTARTHMKNLMRKTGCHRQVELVQLVQAFGR